MFIDEQRIAADLEWDEADYDSLHAVAFNRMGLPLATGRLLTQAPGVARIGRMATRSILRGSNVGRTVLDALVTAARTRGDGEVLLNAQLTAQSFYARAGFRPYGAVFEEAGIPHIEMTMAL